ncbi:curli production assembly/transport component CsgF [Rheinheimera pacifica]|uniref:curli assembly protein CsgF n=1 Tax=Rheinheimera pacifica TaxID=173990 RepID=UPI000CB9915B|nr:curli assembly protein CsgF [Rheinheimera pacifica]MDR6982938.1 curli production assembly/transport component CsgF [Rheinheimera pacifica]PKM20035.1 MAG: curli production assembly protein CsgF [Gammaproteobacteria bacterium HGW-Gammaproteobacteria-15]
MKWICLLLFMLSAGIQATELVYTPINPSFGGNALNGNFLLQKAQSQNAHTASRPGQSFVDKFREALERSIINSLTRRIADGELVEGVYNTGEFLVEVTTGTNGSVIVNITNLNTGEITVITIPVIGG